MHLVEGEEGLGEVAQKVKEAGLTIVVGIAKPAAWRAFGLPPAQKAWLKELVARQPVLVAALGSPVVLDDFSNAWGCVCAYSDVAVSQLALAAYLEAVI